MDRQRLNLSVQAMLGVAAVLVGALLLLDNFDILDARMYLRFWPLLLVVFGAVKAFSSAHRGGQILGGAIALVGVLLVVRELGFTSVGLFELWPLVLILVGASLLFGGSSRRWIPPAQGAPADSHNTVNAFAVLGGVQQASNAQDFRGGEASAILGGVELDLRQAVMQSEEAVITTFALWGGIKIRVPAAWSVLVQGIPFLGGFDDKTAKPADPSARRLVIRGTAVMGGVELTN
ncbi:MAG TPA: DUF5668 domain-containing protein [Bacteroidota bacterium]|nr:DUF5668 domain-containing protein [Bacteroidota bacterium]